MKEIDIGRKAMLSDVKQPSGKTRQKYVFLFLNAATFPGISDQTHGVNNRKSQQIHCIVVKEQFDIFDRKSF